VIKAAKKSYIAAYLLLRNLLQTYYSVIYSKRIPEAKNYRFFPRWHEWEISIW
jgi:hypothetical protein